MLSPGSNIGRYVVKRRLAEGGMAEVYLAQAVGPEGFAKDVVIKVVRSFLASDQQFIDMFINEARLSSRLNHANVVQIFDFGKHDDSYFIAMEYVRGASLFDLRKRCRDRSIPFPPTLVAEIGAQVARGLQYAHSLTDKGKPLGIVHRDVTPHNVLLSFDGAVKLTDFGIAKASTTHTAPGVLKGKFAYMSPEQARGDVVDARTDIFALGVVLWEMLTGGRLFDGDNEMAVLRSVHESLIAPPSRLNPDVPPELSDITLKALSRPLHERFQTAFELEKALATFVLRAAKSVEDSSVSLFLQQVYRDELEAEDRPMTPLGVPAVQRGVVPQASSFGSGDTLAVDRSRELARGRALPTQHDQVNDPPTDEGPAQTAPHRAAAGPEAFAPTYQRDAVAPKGPRTDSMPALGPQKTDQLRALEPSSSSRTDQVPALRPPSEGTDIFGPSRPPTADKRTDPERVPLGANLGSNSGVKLSPSMQLDVQRHGAATERQPVLTQREALATGAALPPVRGSEPTVLKPRAIALELEPSAPTAAAEPPPAKRSPAVLIGSVTAGLLVLAVGGYAVFGAKAKSATDTPTVVTPTPLADPTPPVKPPEPTPVEPRPAVATGTDPKQPDPSPAVDPTKPADVLPVVAPALPPVAVEEPVDAGVAPVAVAAVVKPDPRPAAVRTGLLNVKAIPFAEVLIDGRKSGEVQGTKTLKLPVGKHKVTLVHPKRSEAFDVTIDGKAAAEITFNVNR
jgi:serine/threonine-protein kinase